MAEKRSLENNQASEWVQNVTLPNDYGEDVTFTGQLAAEDMHFNNLDGKLTVEKVYKNEEEKIAYSVISAVGHTRERRAYTIEEKQERCLVSNGSVTMDLITDELLLLLSMALAEKAEAEDSADEHVRERLAVGDNR